MPEPKKPPLADPYASLPDTSTQAQQDPYANMPDAFIAPKNNKEGLYQMQRPDGTMVEGGVPHSKVMDAYKAGYLIAPKDYETYAKNHEYELKKAGKPFDPNVDLPRSFDEVTASPTPYTLPWIKQKAENMREGVLNLLPTAFGIGGGLLTGGAGLESGPADIAIATTGATMGGALGEDVRQSAERRLHPYEHRLTPAESARKIAVQGGIQGINELGGRVGSRYALGPAAEYFRNTAAASKKAGIALLPSEAAGKSPSIVEKLAKESIFTKGKMERFRALQNSQSQVAVESLANSIDNFRGTPEELGKMVKGGIEAHKKTFRLLQNSLYGDIDKAIGQKTIQVPIYKSVSTGILDASGNPVMRTMQTGTEEKIVDSVMPSLNGHYDASGQYIEGLKDFATKELKELDQEEKVFSPALLKKGRRMLQTIIKAPDNMNYQAMANARSDALGIARKLDRAMSGKESGFAKRMAQLYDESMMDAANKSGIQGLPEKIREANQITAEEHVRFEQALIKKIVKTKKPEAIASLLTGDIANQEARDLFSVLPADLHAPVQREVIMDTMREATDPLSKAFNERQFAKNVAEMGDERGNIIFGDNWKNIKELSAILEKIKSPMGMSGSAASLQNAGIIKGALGGSGIGAAALATATGHPAAGAEILGAEAVMILGYAYTYRALASALTNPEMAVKIIKAAQALNRATPYAIMGAVNETGGVNKNVHKVKDLLDEWNKNHPSKTIHPPESKAEDLQNEFHKSGLAPAPAPAEGTGPQLSLRPTHRFDESTNSIVSMV